MVVWQCYSLYTIWVPEGLCQSDVCFDPAYDFDKHRFDICFFLTPTSRPIATGSRPVLSKTGCSLRDGFDEAAVRIPLFADTRASNRTVFLHAGVNLARDEGCNATQFHQTASVALVKFQPATVFEERFLVSGGGDKNATRVLSPAPVAHWTPWVKLRVVLDSNRYEPRSMRGKHVPTIYFDELHLLRKSLLPLSTNSSYPDPSCRIRYLPTSLGVARILSVLDRSMQQMRALAFSESETDELLQLMSPDRLYILILTYVVSFLHTFFAALAFKNDVTFWRNASDMYGLSKRSVIGNAICSVVLFLFLLDSRETSWLIIFTMGIGALIEIWKTSRILGITGAASKRDFSEAEKETNKIDKAGMRYLWFFLWPAIIGWGIYSLFHHQHRSWYSWLISSLANGGKQIFEIFFIFSNFLIVSVWVWISYDVASNICELSVKKCCPFAVARTNLQNFLDICR